MSFANAGRFAARAALTRSDHPPGDLLGGRTPQNKITSGAMVALIGAFLFWHSTRSDHDTHQRDGRTLAFVTGMIPCPLTTFIMSYALARGLLGAGLAVTAAMALGMIATIGGIALGARPFHGAALPN